MNTDFFRRSAVILLRLEAAIVLTLACYLVVESIFAAITHPSALISEVLFGLIGAGGLYAASKGFAQGKSYGRAPAVLANAIALGVAYFMFSGGDVIYLAIPLTILAGATFIAALFGYKE
jgi:hypothetical protein